MIPEGQRQIPEHIRLQREAFVRGATLYGLNYYDPVIQERARQLYPTTVARQRVVQYATPHGVARQMRLSPDDGQVQTRLLGEGGWVCQDGVSVKHLRMEGLLGFLRALADLIERPTEEVPV